MPNRGSAEYLALAEHAEKAAEEAPTDFAKECWRVIANEYRALAADKQKRAQDDGEANNRA